MIRSGDPTLIPGIAEAICDRILRGQLREGEVIHQTELARELGVSPVPLRAVLESTLPTDETVLSAIRTRYEALADRPTPAGLLDTAGGA